MLTLNARGLVAFLHVAGLVDDPDAVGGAVSPSHPPLQPVTSRPLIPPGQAQKLLQRPRSNPRGIRYGFDALTLKVAELPGDIGGQVLLRPDIGKTAVELV